VGGGGWLPHYPADTGGHLFTCVSGPTCAGSQTDTSVTRWAAELGAQVRSFRYTVKKVIATFPLPAGMSLAKLSLGGNNLRECVTNFFTEQTLRQATGRHTEKKNSFTFLSYEHRQPCF
jgi:hypothetical protein